MQIGELAQHGGVTVQAVRFYERKGLLPKPQRKESGYRIYGAEGVRRLAFIRQSKMLGFSLAEIAETLRTREKGECPCGEVLKMAEGHLTAVETQIRHLQKFRLELRRAVKEWRRSGKQSVSGDAICTLIERTMVLKARKGEGK